MAAAGDRAKSSCQVAVQKAVHMKRRRRRLQHNVRQIRLNCFSDFMNGLACELSTTRSSFTNGKKKDHTRAYNGVQRSPLRVLQIFTYVHIIRPALRCILTVYDTIRMH